MLHQSCALARVVVVIFTGRIKCSVENTAMVVNETSKSLPPSEGVKHSGGLAHK